MWVLILRLLTILFIIDALNPTDDYPPILNYLYVDYAFKGDAKVECWNFLGYDFSQYYSETTNVWTFVKLTLPAETPDYDLDDPHILIDGNRRVFFVLEAYDNITQVNTGAAPYT